MRPNSRRTCLKHITVALAANALPGIFRPQRAFALEAYPPVPSQPEIAAITDIAQRFMHRYEVPGLSLAIARRGRLVYRDGFGYADTERRERVTSAHLFRIASVTKPITSTAVFSLIERGKFGLDDLVFGNGGLLQSYLGRNIPDQVKQITVRHLLTHTCGGWGNSVNDPMFASIAMNHRQLIESILRTQPLQFTPGTHYGYSNFGYCLLGRILESISGQTYVEFVRQNILAKCGINAMRLAGNTLAERAHNEVVYYGQGGANPYNMNLRVMDSHGGWIATPTDLVQFAMHVDGFQTTPNILRADTIQTMTAPDAINPGYACGWAVNKVPNWWHIGSLPGTSSIIVRTASGLCWAACANTHDHGIDQAIDDLMWDMVRAVPAWQA